VKSKSAFLLKDDQFLRHIICVKYGFIKMFTLYTSK
jgi:hypothetical protein